MDNDNVLCSRLRLGVSHHATHADHEGKGGSLSQYGHVSLQGCFNLPVVSRDHLGAGQMTGDG